MNISALHHTLTRLSESEQKYKKGYRFTGWSCMPTETIENRTVFRLSTDSMFAMKEPNMSAEHLNFHNHLLINRNSRFNPIPEHIHSNIELNYVYSGVCPQTINGKELLLTKNQVLLIDTDCPHSIAYLGEDDIMLSITIQHDFLRDHLFSQFSKDSILSGFFVNAITEKTSHDHYLLFHSEKNRRIPMFFHELLCECYDPSINSNDIVMHLFYLIMAELINVYENDMLKEDHLLDQAPVASIIRYIEHNYRTCTQESVAEFFHISPNYVSILLKKHLGISYINLIQEQKLGTAAQLLKNTTLPVTEIAHEAGYENVSFFYKKFASKYGCSPTEYRSN